MMAVAFSSQICVHFPPNGGINEPPLTFVLFIGEALGGRLFWVAASGITSGAWSSRTIEPGFTSNFQKEAAIIFFNYYKVVSINSSNSSEVSTRIFENISPLILILNCNNECLGGTWYLHSPISRAIFYLLFFQSRSKVCALHLAPIPPRHPNHY